MIYYIITAYILATLWFSTHCSDCYFSKKHYIVINKHNNTLPIIHLRTFKMGQNNSNINKYSHTCHVTI